MLRCITWLVLGLIFQGLSQAALADAQIRIELVTGYDRLRPTVHKGIVLRQTINATLTSDGRVEETIVRNAGAGNAGTSTASRDLGQSLPAGVSWIVAGPDKLQRRIETPQNISTLTISVTGDLCKVELQHKLKPGFSDYMFRRISDGSWAYFTEPKLQSSSCSIREVASAKPRGDEAKAIPAAPGADAAKETPTAAEPARDGPADKKQ